MSDLPFTEESIIAGVRQHLDVVADIRWLKEHAERHATDLASFIPRLSRLEIDLSRCLNHATIAVAEVGMVKKAVAAMHVDIRRLLERGENGHG